MAVNLGAGPETLTVTLVRGADFVSQLTRKDATPWPAGSEVALEFTVADGSKINWIASYSAATATWNVDTAVVEALIAQRIRTARLWYIEGELKVLWAFGEADIQGI